MIHILIGHEAAAKLEMAFQEDENLVGEILVLKDTLGIGPIGIPGENTFSEGRTQFWKTLQPGAEIEVEDEMNLLAVIEKAKAEEEPLCLWLAPCVSDFCAYYWLLPYFKPHPGMLHTINIVGLPFLNEKGQIFYPKNFSEIPPREFVKTKRLLKEVSASEYEVDGDEWDRFTQEKSWVRIYEGGRKIVSKKEDYYDSLILNATSGTATKASKILNEAQKKCSQTLSHLYLEWRIRELIQSGVLISIGDSSKPLKEFEVKKAGDPNNILEENSVGASE